MEDIVGAAVKESNLPRSSLTIVSKFVIQANKDPSAALQETLAKTGLDYIDVYLMHWPWSTKADGKGYHQKGESPTFIETWIRMQKLLGPTCKAIGVSNFTQLTLDELLAAQGVTVTPAINQVELHALNPNLNLVPYCKEKGIHVMSWSTLGGPPAPGKSNPIINDSFFHDLAKKYDCGVGVVSLSWCVQRGVTVIPKSANLGRIEENIRLVHLSDDDMDAMNRVGEKLGKVRLADDISFGKGHVEGKGPVLFGWTKEEYGWEDNQGNWLV